MVEVTQTMFRRILIYALGAVFLTAGGVRAQQPEVEARIAGLEGNAEYMSLLREDAQLQIREDSIVNAVERMRRQLREDPGKRQQYSQEILQLESRIFEIRNAKGRLIDRINTIEQEWVLASLNGAARNLSLDPEAAKVTYRVEITGTDALSDEVKGVIAATGEVYELSRVGSQLFVVGAFDDRAVADRLAESIRQTDAALEVKVAEIAE